MYATSTTDFFSSFLDKRSRRSFISNFNSGLAKRGVYSFFKGGISREVFIIKKQQYLNCLPINFFKYYGTFSRAFFAWKNCTFSQKNIFLHLVKTEYKWFALDHRVSGYHQS